MAPPSSYNYDIDPVPYSQLVTQAVFNVDNEVWFKYVATEPIVLGAQATVGGTFSPLIGVYESDGTTVIGFINNGYTGAWWILASAGDYYVRVSKYPSGGASDFDFTFNSDTRPLNVIDIEAGNIIVNDDAPNYAAVVIDTSGATGVHKFFASAVPAGEYGAILPSNVSVWHDLFGQHLADSVAVFDANLSYITSVTAGIGTNVPAFGTDIANNQFYVLGITTRELWTISPAGVTAYTGYTFPSGAFIPELIAINETGTILYWAQCSISDGIIHALDLTTFTPLPDFFTIPGFTASFDDIALTPNGHIGDMFVLADGKVVTWWRNRGTGDRTLMTIDTDGTLLYTYVTPATAPLNHLAYIHEATDEIMVWQYNTGLDTGYFYRLELSTGTINPAESITDPLFSGAVNMTTEVMFGPCTSCTFLRFASGVVTPPTITRVTQSVVEVMTILADLGGIYHLPPGKTHDSYYTDIEIKIPNPTVKTALIGE